MRLLLDTHALVWWIRESPHLSAGARAAISADGAAIWVSPISAWEIAIKVGKGQWPEAKELLAEFESAIAAEGFEQLSITVPHVRLAGLMVSDHRDPFDRLLAAQAILDGLTLVTADGKLQALGVACLW